MDKPRALRPGDVIQIVSPSSPTTRDKMEPAVRLLRSAGYEVWFGKHAFDRWDYLAGKDADRAADLQNAFADERVAAVYCSRGGYGSGRLLPLLDLDRMAASNKLFLGFSDITALHLALNRRGLPTVHAPMAISFVLEREAWVAESLLRSLRGELNAPEGAPLGRKLVKGSAEGVVTGGCLCLLCDSIGTPDQLDAEGKIVLIEDVDEAPHRIDAMLTHLIQANILTKAAGIVIGQMTNTRVDASIGDKAWTEIVRERIVPLGIPTMVHYPFGHQRNMLSLALGIRARLDADAGTLTYIESHCA